MHLQMMPMVLRVDAPPRTTADSLKLEFQPHDELHALANVQVRLVQDVDEARMAELEASFRKQSIQSRP